MTATVRGAPRLQRSWDSRAACNFICGGAGTGLLLAAAAALPSGWPYAPAGVLAFALIGFGLWMVWLEIGRPLRALNVFFHPQTSWMTREALLALPLLIIVGAAILLDQRIVPLPFKTHGTVIDLAWAGAVLGLAFLYCQARILTASKGVPAWREPSLQSVIVITGITEGLGLLLLLGLAVATPPSWVFAAGLVALAARAGAWEYYRRRVAAGAPATATAALNRISSPVHLLGHVLAAVLLIVALITPTPVLPAAGAGLALVAVGAWLKFTVVTRAAFTQGFAIPFLPVRGRAGS